MLDLTKFTPEGDLQSDRTAINLFSIRQRGSSSSRVTLRSTDCTKFALCLGEFA